MSLMPIFWSVGIQKFEKINGENVQINVSCKTESRQYEFWHCTFSKLKPQMLSISIQFKISKYNYFQKYKSYYGIPENVLLRLLETFSLTTSRTNGRQNSYAPYISYNTYFTDCSSTCDIAKFGNKYKRWKQQQVFGADLG